MSDPGSNGAPPGIGERERGRFMVIALIVSATVMGGLTLGGVIGGFVTSAIDAESSAYSALVPIMFGFVALGGVAGIRAGLWAAQKLVGPGSAQPRIGISMLLAGAGLVTAAAVATAGVGLIMPILVLLPGIGAALGDVYAARRGRPHDQVADTLKKRG